MKAPIRVVKPATSTATAPSIDAVFEVSNDETKAPSALEVHALLMNRIENLSPSAKINLLGELIGTIAFERLDSLTDLMERINRIEKWYRKE